MRCTVVLKGASAFPSDMLPPLPAPPLRTLVVCSLAHARLPFCVPVSIVSAPGTNGTQTTTMQGYCPNGTACRLKHELPDPRKRARDVAAGGDHGVSICSMQTIVADFDGFERLEDFAQNILPRVTYRTFPRYSTETSALHSWLISGLVALVHRRKSRIHIPSLFLFLFS